MFSRYAKDYVKVSPLLKNLFYVQYHVIISLHTANICF